MEELSQREKSPDRKEFSYDKRRAIVKYGSMDVVLVEVEVDIEVVLSEDEVLDPIAEDIQCSQPYLSQI